MSKKIFLHTLNIAAKESHFHFTRRAFQDEFLRYNGDVAPAIWPDIKHVRGIGYKFLCFFSIDVMEFETQWTRNLALNGFDHKSADSMGPIGAHSNNYDLGMLPPYLPDNANDDEISEMNRWMLLVFEHALRFPTSIEQLSDVLAQGSILGSDVFRLLGQPVKVRAFFLWLRHNGIIDLVDKLTIIPDSRIWPYNNIDIDNWCKINKC